MNWFRKNKWKILIPTLIALALTAAFFFDGSPAPVPAEPEPAVVQTEKAAALPQTAQEDAHGGDAFTATQAKKETDSAPSDEKPPEAPPMPPEKTAQKASEAEQPGQPESAPTPETEQATLSSEQAPQAAEKAEPEDTELHCTVSISCAKALEHPDWLIEGLAELLPEDGALLSPTEVVFYEGESVFNVLQRYCRQAGIHLEFSNTPIYNSAYIEGIGNLYQFDCGALSGWMYQVNGCFPNFGCSFYTLCDGDEIVWQYTCDLGNDIGGADAAAGQRE